MNNKISHLASSLPIPRGRALVIRSVIFVLGFLLFSGLVWAFLWYFGTYLERPLHGLAPYAYGAVFLANLLASATVVIPGTGLSIALGAATKFDPFWVAVAMSLGTTLGEATAYLAGYWGGAAVARHHPPMYHRAEAWMRRYGFWAVFVVALFPLVIFDIVGIVAGVLRLPMWKFLLATYAGRLPRSFVEIYAGGRVIQWIMGLFS